MSNLVSRRNLLVGSASAAALSALPAHAMLDLAPDFTLPNSKGEQVSLSQFAGKPIVLEWTNHGCPYVRRKYENGSMQALQAKTVEDGGVWLSIVSSAPGRQGYVDGLEADMQTESRGASPSHVLLDPEGRVGRLYSARTTPHMFVIDQTGQLAYAGAIDDSAWGAPNVNYVTAALDSLAQGQLPDIRTTRAYGCSVKYGS